MSDRNQRPVQYRALRLMLSMDRYASGLDLIRISARCVHSCWRSSYDAPDSWGKLRLVRPLTLDGAAMSFVAYLHESAK